MTIEEARDLIRSGAIVRMGFSAGSPVWWFNDPYASVEALVIKAAATGHNGQPLLVEAGDSLFGWTGNSQTWRSTFDD